MKGRGEALTDIKDVGLKKTGRKAGSCEMSGGSTVTGAERSEREAVWADNERKGECFNQIAAD